MFHPESSRVARLGRPEGNMDSPSRLLQVGGNAGASLGPLLVRVHRVAIRATECRPFSLAKVLLAIALLSVVGRWYKRRRQRVDRGAARSGHDACRGSHAVACPLLPSRCLFALVSFRSTRLSRQPDHLLHLLRSKFNVSVESAEFYLFAFLAAVAAGTFIGGPVGDRVGRKYVIQGVDPRRSPVHA